MWNGVSSKIGRHEFLLKSSRGMFINTGSIFSETALRNWFILKLSLAIYWIVRIIGSRANPTKWSIKSKIVWQQPTNCLNVFDHFVELALTDTDREKAPSNKTPALAKVQQINYLQEALKLKQNFQKNKAVTGKTTLFVIGPFFTHHLICLLIWKFCMEMMPFQS